LTKYHEQGLVTGVKLHQKRYAARGIRPEQHSSLDPAAGAHSPCIEICLRQVLDASFPRLRNRYPFQRVIAMVISDVQYDGAIDFRLCFGVPGAFHDA